MIQSSTAYKKAVTAVGVRAMTMNDSMWYTVVVGTLLLDMTGTGMFYKTNEYLI